jgi:electron-transferring-flavoprotein dehydrogenase
MKSGMLAAEAAFDAVSNQETDAADLSAYEDKFKHSWVYSDLHEVRNVRPSFNTSLGIWGGMAYSGIDSLIKGNVPWTLKHHGTDAKHTKRAKDTKPIDYPPFEAPLSTDLMTSVSLTGTNHAEDQPVHLVIRTPTEQNEELTRRKEHVATNVGEYAGLLGRACPAGVYEYVEANESEPDSMDGKKLVINSQVRISSARSYYGLIPHSKRTASIVSCAI